MLGHLFGSKSRVKILKLFLLHPEDKYYIRQIARDLGLQINSVRRELENLEDFGLLVSGSELEQEQVGGDVVEILQETAQKTKGKKSTLKGTKKETLAKAEKKYFKVNKNFVLYREIRDLIVRAQILYEKDFIEKLAKAGKTKLLVFSAIFVNNENSPVDLFLVGRFNKSKLFKLIADLEKELGCEINFTVMETQEFKYRRDITDVFLYEILENKKIMVINELDVA